MILLLTLYSKFSASFKSSFYKRYNYNVIKNNIDLPMTDKIHKNKQELGKTK